MLSMMVFLTLICVAVGFFTGTLPLALAVALPAWLVPLAIYRAAPGSVASRLAIACALMIYSALTIQLTQGMTETHFGIFTLLAFLLYYRDWRPIVVAAGLIAVHHVAFGALQYLGTGGVYVLDGEVNVGVIVLHAAYVEFEAGVLIFMADILQREAVESAMVAELAGQISEGDFSTRGTELPQARFPLLRKVSTMRQSLQVTLQDIVGVMTAVAQGHLDRRVTVEARGDLGALKSNINQSLDALRGAMTTIHQNARQVAAASGEASNAIGQISDGARQQTDAISRVSGAVRQTVTSVAEVSSNTELASQRSRQSFSLVRGSMDKMQAMVTVVNNIAANSEKINKITDVIEKIANKTNLLSLNGAIEAARAGEHGKGFAVVADEVGKLALNSAESSQEIAVLVRQAVKEANSAVKAVMEVSQDMAGIEQETQATDQMLQRIASALEEQSAAVEQINANLNNLDQIARSNAAASEEIAATVMELSRIADATRREVQKFET